MGKLEKQELGKIVLLLMLRIFLKKIQSGADVKTFLKEIAKEKQIEYQDLAEIVDYSLDNMIATKEVT